MTGKRGPRSAEDRIRGLLVMLPWLMQRESVLVADMARQFNMSEKDLIEDIELAAMCGTPPYTPLELTDLYIDEGRIIVGPNKYFERRLELSPAEAFGLSLLAAAAEDIPGFTRRRELKSALKKLRKVLGESIVDVDVESPEFLDDVSDAATSGAKLRITYWTPGRNEESTREIVVRSVFTDRGHWYVSADDGLSGERRHFRVDRIRSVAPTGETVSVVPESAAVPEWFADPAGKLVVVAEVAEEAAWIVETYPCTVLEERQDGSFRIEMVANSTHWLGRLLLRAGAGMTVVAPEEMVDLASRTAREVLAVYSRNSDN